jgi:uncharacterized protein (DUF362 family)
MAAAAAGAATFGRPAHAAAPAAPVAIAKCRSYGPELVTTLDAMFDQLGGLERIVKGKTVAIKVNLTGSANYRLGYTPAELAQWTHPQVIGATVHLMNRAGAKRVRILESAWSTAEPLEETMMEAGWDPGLILNAGGRVEMENTNSLGLGSRYHRFQPANNGHLFREYWLNHSYEDCDVFASIAKLKEHVTTGVTMSMKNLFGITPCTIYGDGAGTGEPTVLPKGGRGTVFHAGRRQPAKISVAENDPNSSREAGYRVPRAVSDLVSARPVHLAIIDGIATMAGGEGPWCGPQINTLAPGVMIAGTNCVSTDAVGAAVMGFDPMADRGKAPFETSDNMMRLAEELEVGTRDLNRIEVVGVPIAQAKFDMRSFRTPVTRTRRG